MEAEPIDTFPPLEQTSRLDGGEQQTKKIGAYRIESVLGSGGMGKVYLGIDESLERKAAIKVIAEHLAPSLEVQQRLNTEARAAARLNHPNIVQVYAFGHEDRLTYIAFEYVNGRDVDNILKKDGKLDLKTALSLTKQAAQGLRFAYSQNIIHRDIKPANLMMLPDGTVKIADFGLAKELDKDHMKTSMNAIIGSPAFMSPEQGQGRTLDFRSDIYSLGATLFSALTGTIPFKGETAISVILMHANDPLPEPPEISRHLNGGVMELVKKMMAKKPEDRHQSYDELIADIERLETGTVAWKKEVHFTTPPQRQIPAGKKNPTWLIVAGIAGLILTAAVLVRIFNGGGTRKSPAVFANDNSPTLSERYKKPEPTLVVAELTPEPTPQSLDRSVERKLLIENKPARSALSMIAEDEFPESLLVEFAQMTPAQKPLMQQVTRKMHETERFLFDGMASFLPFELFADSPEKRMTLTAISPNETTLMINQKRYSLSGPSSLPREVKVEIARFAGTQLAPERTDVASALLFFRYMHFDPEVTQEAVLNGATNPVEAAELTAMMQMRNLFQILAREAPPPPQNGGQQRQPRPLGNRIRDRITGQ